LPYIRLSAEPIDSYESPVTATWPLWAHNTIFAFGLWSRIHFTLSAMLRSRVTSPTRICIACSTMRACWIAQSTSRPVAPRAPYPARPDSRCATTSFQAAAALHGVTAGAVDDEGAAPRYCMRRLCFPEWLTPVSSCTRYPWPPVKKPLGDDDSKPRSNPSVAV